MHPWQALVFHEYHEQITQKMETIPMLCNETARERKREERKPVIIGQLLIPTTTRSAPLKHPLR
jgi:hypothetical protein